MTSAVVSKPHRLKYDVFISFTGDTRHGFTEKLYKALVDENVRVFRDNEALKKGAELNPSLVEAMEDSAASVVVFSPTYPSSHWCLDELDKLFAINKRMNHTMLPIFYKVDPSHVRKPNVHFKDDFDRHVSDGRFNEEKMERWRRAMIDFGNHNGYVYKIPLDSGEGKSVEGASEEGESEEGASEEAESEEEVIIKLVVKRVLDEVSNTPEKVGEYTVGLDSSVGDLMKLVDFRSSHDGARIMGLYGMGGIGKTTLAKRFYNRVLEKFDEHRVFLPNVREQSSSEKGGLVNLQGSFIAGLFHTPLPIEDVNKGQDMIRGRVREKKILAVLDNVDSVDQVEALVGERGWYGKGSLIVITTRDKEILNKLSVKLKYEVRCLTEMQALNLFSFHSLRKEKPTNSLLELSKKFIEITGRLPLAVEVFASSLYDKNEKEWHAHLAKVKDNQPTNLHDVLKMSFESLDDEEKKVFLDISCFFLKMDITKEEVVDVLNGCGFNAEAALRVLREKSLLKILADRDNALWMHDQIRDMGTQMVLNESREDPGMRSRLWDRDEIIDVLDNKKGTASIRGIVCDFKKKFSRDPTAYDIASRNLQNNLTVSSVVSYLKYIFVRFPAEEMPKSSEITLPVEPFAPMSKLRLLQINNVELKGNLKLLPSELKWIQWKGCPLQNIPPDFLNGQLAVLDLSDSRIRRFRSSWRKKENKNLKVVNLRGCHSLEAIPDLSNHIAIEKLVFERCTLLVNVPRSVGNLKTLLHLDFRNCSNLAEFLVDVSGLKCLEKLFLSGCSILSVLPENIGDMTSLKELLIDGTAIKSLPESISHLEKLEKLSLNGCRSIQELPSCVGMLTSLEELYLNSTSLRNLPSSICRLTSLQKLHCMHCSSLSTIPDTINKLSALKEFFINGSAVEELPLNIGSLPSLADFSAGQCRSLKQVPSSIGGLNSLLQLQLDSTPIETLPKEIGHLRFIWNLELMNCKSLKFLPESICDLDTLRRLNLEGSNIEKLPENFGKLESLVMLRMNNCKELKGLPESFGKLKSLCHLYMEETLVLELPESFGNLSKLMVLKMLKKPLFRSSVSVTREEPRFVIPNSFSNLGLLEDLDARSWGITGKIPDSFGKLSSLKILYLNNNYFHSLPSSLEKLSNLTELSLNDCQELMRLPPLPCQLERLNMANCFALKSISDLSKLTILDELNLTNCKKVYDIPGLEKLEGLKRLYMSGCNKSFSIEVRKRLSKVALKMLRNLSLPGNKIPDWFSQGPVTYSSQPNKELKGVIIAVVVAINQESKYEQELPCVVGIRAQIHKLDHCPLNHTLHLYGVPRTSNDQLHICRYSHLHPMVTMLKDGYTLQVIQQELENIQGAELKMHGIYLVYEGDDDRKAKEDLLTKTNQTVSQKLANFLGSFEEGETSSAGDSIVT